MIINEQVSIFFITLAQSSLKKELLVSNSFTCIKATTVRIHLIFFIPELCKYLKCIEIMDVTFICFSCDHVS